MDCRWALAIKIPVTGIMTSESPAATDINETQFLKYLELVAAWIANYRSTISQRMIQEQSKPGEITSRLPPEIPEDPEHIDSIFHDFETIIVPGLLHWGHPRFAGYFGSTTNGPAILGEALAASLNVSAMTWQTSPAATELETVVIQWIRSMLKLPRAWTGIVYDTASISTMHALIAAREKAFPGSAIAGLNGSGKAVIYQSSQAHSSIVKAAAVIGIGKENVRMIPVDEHFRMNPEVLESSIERDLRNGFTPVAIVATIGTTSTASVDPIESIGQIAAKHNIWFHVDAAYGGAFSILDEGEFILKGIEYAHSYVINPHKWLLVPLDFSVLYLKSTQILRSIFSVVPEYLKGDTREDAINYMDYGIQLGRRFRALKAWFVFRAFGKSGLQQRIRQNCRHARLFASLVEESEIFELAAPVSMGVVCFRAANNTVNEPELLHRINNSGDAYLTMTELHGRKALRAAFGNLLTTDPDVQQIWNRITIETDYLLQSARSS